MNEGESSSLPHPSHVCTKNSAAPAGLSLGVFLDDAFDTSTEISYAFLGFYCLLPVCLSPCWSTP